MVLWIWKYALTLGIIYNANCTNQPELRIEQGVLKGLYRMTVNRRLITSFEGIPFAKPPVGNHRFKPPVAAGLWYGVLNATDDPPKCLQNNLYATTPSLLGSEDCLYLNVYTPQLPSDTRKLKLLDVIAFIHGGAYKGGNSKLHSPAILLQRNLVLVTFNYRLGPLGFLSTEDGIVPGNNGLKDQLLALKWIQQNIAAFGGNPNSVTLGGHSAGSSSVHYHLLSPLSKGLFKSVILMSGVALNPWALAENSKEKAKFVANDLGCPTNDSRLMINCLRNRPADHIVKSTNKLLYWMNHPVVTFGPVIEPVGPDSFISAPPVDIMKNKGVADVPMLVSFVADEGLIVTANIITNLVNAKEFLNRWDEIIPFMLDYNYTVSLETMTQINQKIKEYYKIDKSTEGLRNLVKLVTDRLFTAGISKFVKMSAMLNSSPLYLYKFSYRGQYSLTHQVLGVCHGDDLFYTLGHNVEKEEVIYNGKDLKISKRILDIWVSFAANGTPGENWQQVNKQLPSIVYYDIKDPDGFKLTVADELGEESFWDSLSLNENIVSTIISHEEL